MTTDPMDANRKIKESVVKGLDPHEHIEGDSLKSVTEATELPETLIAMRNDVQRQVKESSD